MITLAHKLAYYARLAETAPERRAARRRGEIVTPLTLEEWALVTAPADRKIPSRAAFAHDRAQMRRARASATR